MKSRLIDEPGFAAQTTALLERIGTMTDMSDYDSVLAARAFGRLGAENRLGHADDRDGGGRITGRRGHRKIRRITAHVRAQQLHDVGLGLAGSLPEPLSGKLAAAVLYDEFQQVRRGLGLPQRLADRAGDRGVAAAPAHRATSLASGLPWRARSLRNWPWS